MAVLQSIVDNPLVLLNWNGTRWVHDVAASLWVRIDAINCSENQFFLQMTEPHNVFLGLLRLDLGVSCNDAEASAGSVQQTTVEFLKHIGQFATILTRDNGVWNTQSVHVSVQWLETLFLHVVCNQNACVFHELSDIRCFTAWGSSHIQNTLIWLGSKGHHGQERTWWLEDVVASQVLRGCTDGNLRLINFQSNLRPLSNRVQTDTSLNQNFGQILTLSFERVSSDSHGSLILISLNKVERLLRTEQIKDQLQQVQVVVVTLVDVCFKLVHVVNATSALLAKLFEVSKNTDRFLHTHLDNSQIFFS